MCSSSIDSRRSGSPVASGKLEKANGIIGDANIRTKNLANFANNFAFGKASTSLMIEQGFSAHNHVGDHQQGGIHGEMLLQGHSWIMRGLRDALRNGSKFRTEGEDKDKGVPLKKYLGNIRQLGHYCSALLELAREFETATAEDDARAELSNNVLKREKKLQEAEARDAKLKANGMAQFTIKSIMGHCKGGTAAHTEHTGFKHTLDRHAKCTRSRHHDIRILVEWELADDTGKGDWAPSWEVPEEMFTNGFATREVHREMILKYYEAKDIKDTLPELPEAMEDEEKKTTETDSESGSGEDDDINLLHAEQHDSDQEEDVDSEEE